MSVGYPGDYVSWPRDRQNRAYAEGAYADRKPSTPATLKTAAEFCAEYAPLSYAVEPIVRSRSLYTLTAKTGAGKTALMTAAGLAVPTGRSDILGVEVEQGPGRLSRLRKSRRRAHAAYDRRIFAQCGPADLADRLVVLDVRTKPEDVIVKLASAHRAAFHAHSGRHASRRGSTGRTSTTTSKPATSSAAFGRLRPCPASRVSCSPPTRRRAPARISSSPTAAAQSSTRSTAT